MCSIAGMIELSGNRIPGLAHKLNVMNDLQAHRGPDGHGVWMHQLRTSAWRTAGSALSTSPPASNP